MKKLLLVILLFVCIHTKAGQGLLVLSKNSTDTKKIYYTLVGNVPAQCSGIATYPNVIAEKLYTAHIIRNAKGGTKTALQEESIPKLFMGLFFSPRYKGELVISKDPFDATNKKTNALYNTTGYAMPKCTVFGMATLTVGTLASMLAIRYYFKNKNEQEA